MQIELRNTGFETYGALAFAVSTTPQQITDTVMDEWLQKITTRNLSSFQLSCIRRLVVESHALALNDLQKKVDQPSDPMLAHRKLPVAERQIRQKEQEERLEGIIFSPETIPSHALVDMCVTMLEQNIRSSRRSAPAVLKKYKASRRIPRSLWTRRASSSCHPKRRL